MLILNLLKSIDLGIKFHFNELLSLLNRLQSPLVSLSQLLFLLYFAGYIFNKTQQYLILPAYILRADHCLLEIYIDFTVNVSVVCDAAPEVVARPLGGRDVGAEGAQGALHIQYLSLLVVQILSLLNC